VPDLADAIRAPYFASIEGTAMSTEAGIEADIEPNISWDVAKLTREQAYVRRGFWSKLRRLAARLPFAEDLLAAYYCAFDRDTPRHVQATLVGALAYFVLPFDIIPDMLPVLGFTDDAAVLATAIKLVASHIRPQHRDAARRAIARGLTEG
jgi:uncharacterized membrane protein YkvA (DUF1232 family)